MLSRIRDRGNNGLYRKEIMILLTSGILLLLPITNMTTLAGLPLIGQAEAGECLLSFEVFYEKILVLDDHDHFPVLESDPGEWTLHVFDPQSVVNVEVMSEQNVWDVEENGDGNAGVYFLFGGEGYKTLPFTIPYDGQFQVGSLGSDDDFPQTPELLGFVGLLEGHELVYSASNSFGIGSHEEASNEGDYHLFYTISLVSRSPFCPPDDDFDGILESVDNQPTIFSNEFNDKDIGGTTEGIVTSRGDQIFTIEEEPNPLGVRVTGIAGGSTPATIELPVCGMINEFHSVLPETQFIVTCVNPAHLTVIQGLVLTTLSSDEGISAQLEVPEGNAISFDRHTGFITAAPSNPDTLIAMTSDGRQLPIGPGISVSITDTTPPDTTIESAQDGNAVELIGLGETFSKSIRLAFTGNDNVDSPSQLRFECRLDTSDFSECESPQHYTNLDFGEHTVEIRAIDRASNIDASPASFTWIIYLEANIDIKPLDDAVATIVAQGKGTTTVAILGSEEFGDVSNVSISNIEFAGASPSSTKPKFEDVNGDGITDLILKFNTQAMDELQKGDTEACMIGTLKDSTPFKGCDEIRVV